MSKHILGLSGRKHAGKDTLVTFLQANVRELAGERFSIVRSGMSDELKRVCVRLLGLRPEQVYGTEEEKNTPTHLRWEDLPQYPAMQFEANRTNLLRHGLIRAQWPADQEKPPTGFMTGRQVMQVWGTEVFRRAYPDCHVHATLAALAESTADIAVVADVRFPNEVRALRQAGGKVIRLTRNPFPDDSHPSETSLDPDRFPWEEFDYVLDNAHLTRGEQTQVLVRLLHDWGWIPRQRTQVA